MKYHNVPRTTKMLTSLNNIIFTTLSVLLILIPHAHPTNHLVITPYDRSPICQQGPQRSSKIQLYSHNIYTGPNQSLYEVANSSISNTSPSRFGTILVFDNNLTLGPDYNSQQVGRTQGLAVSADLRELAFALYAVIYLDDDDDEGYGNGSTITILGRSEQAEEYNREFPVVGGTGIFRCARGYLIASRYSTDVATNNNVLYNEIYVDHVLHGVQ